jgi:hypothetical protein
MKKKFRADKGSGEREQGTGERKREEKEASRGTLFCRKRVPRPLPKNSKIIVC